MNSELQSNIISKKLLSTRVTTKISCFFILALIICIVFVGCSKTTYVENENVKVYIDERAEFLNVVQYLAAYNYYTSIGKTNRYRGMIIEYLTDIDSSFLQYRNHEAVSKVNGFLSNRVLADGLLASFIGVFNDDFTLNESYLEDNPLEIAAWGGLETFQSLSETLSSFYNEVSFNDFFNKHKDWLNKFANDVRDKSVGSGDVDFLIEYFGNENVTEHKIIVSPISRIMAGYSVVNSDNSETIIAVMGIPKRLSEWKLIFFHELTHGHNRYLKETLEKSNVDLLKYVPMLESIDDFYDYQVVSEEARVIRAIDEYIAHAVALRLVDLRSGSNLVSMPKKMGFIYVNDICEKLKEFENNRDKYPSFDDFVPEIIKLFDELSQS